MFNDSPCCTRMLVIALVICIVVRLTVSMLSRVSWELCRKLGLGQSGPSAVSRFGTWAVVTGATDGIGKALAMALAKRGFNLLLIARNQEKLEKTKIEIKSIGGFKGHVDTLQVDFSDPSLDYDQVIRPKLDKLDIGVLINNVGLSYPSAQYYNELPLKFIDDLISVNVRSTYLMTRLVISGMKQRGRGAIVCLGSGSSQLPTDPLYSAYAGVKSAVEGFCRSLQVEMVQSNIIVQCHVPLLVATKLSKIKTPSLTVMSVESYAEDAMTFLEMGKVTDCATVVPSIIHSLMISCINFIPLPLWNYLRFNEVSKLRSRYMKKLAGNQASQTGTAAEAATENKKGK